jgi:ABC-type transporter Mla MlaB component
MVTTANPSSAPARSGFSAIAGQESGEPGIKVLELGHIDRLMWEANILFSMGRTEEIRTLAKTAQEKGHEMGYELSMALLRIDGNKQDFEDMAVEYAVQTGNSPPVWLDIHEFKKPAESAPKRVEIKVSSLLAENIIETTIKMESPWPLSLDFSEVTKLDAPGLDIFQESLAGRISRDEATKIKGIERILKNVTDRIKAAPAEGNKGLWAFCFNVLRLTGARTQFDDLAGDYVEKTGEDLPIWKDLREEDEINPPQAAQAAVTMGYDVGDSLSKVSPALLSSLSTVAEFKEAKLNGDSFHIDFSNVRRWTVNDMAHVVLLLQQAAKEKIRLDFININEMLLALMKGFAIDKRAKLVVAGGTT